MSNLMVQSNGIYVFSEIVRYDPEDTIKQTSNTFSQTSENLSIDPYIYHSENRIKKVKNRSVPLVIPS